MTSADVEAVPIVDEVEAIYEQHIKKLSVAARLHLLAKVAQDLVAQSPNAPTKNLTSGLVASVPDVTMHTRSLLELEGLGAEIWQGVDAQEYVNQLRSEWDHRL